MKHTIIFDFDGTLVDSAAGVLSSLKSAIASVGMVPTRPIDVDVIGPPLREMLKSVLCEEGRNKIDAAVEAFIEDYDNRGCLQSRPFPGVDKMLHELSASGARLFIATNKRQSPTISILQSLNWLRLFNQIYTVDGQDKPFENKAQMLRFILDNHNLSLATTIYIGDRDDDGEASAIANGMPFLLAAWGYELTDSLEYLNRWPILEAPDAKKIKRFTFDCLETL